MFQRIFGTSKKEKPGHERPKTSGSGGAAHHADPAQSESIPVVTTRTTSPTAGKRNRSSLTDSKLASSSPGSPGSLSAGGGSVPKNHSITIRSDPVPASFKNSNAGSPLSGCGSNLGSPKFQVGSLNSTSGEASFNSPLSQQSRDKRTLPAAATGYNGNGLSGTLNTTSTAPGAATMNGGPGGGGSRPTITVQRVSSPELQFSRSVPMFESSPLLSSTSRAALVSNNSLAIGPGMDGMNGGGTVNYWRLPWTQQKVVMCQYCHRPLRPRQPTQMISKEFVAEGDISSDVDDVNDPSDMDSSSNSSDDCDRSAGLSSPLATYCRCGQGSPLLASSATGGGVGTETDTAGGLAGSGHSRGIIDSQTQQAPPPVFIVETERSSKMVVPGTIADNASSSSDDDEDEGYRRPMKLSLVSPLTSSTLLRNSSYTAANVSASQRKAAGNADETSPPIPLPTMAASRSASKLTSGDASKARDLGASAKSVSSWVQEQQQNLPLEPKEAKAGAKVKSMDTAAITTAKASEPKRRKT